MYSLIKNYTHNKDNRQRSTYTYKIKLIICPGSLLQYLFYGLILIKLCRHFMYGQKNICLENQPTKQHESLPACYDFMSQRFIGQLEKMRLLKSSDGISFHFVSKCGDLVYFSIKYCTVRTSPLLMEDFGIIFIQQL